MATASKVQHPDMLKMCKRFKFKLNTQNARKLKCDSVITNECQSGSTLHDFIYTNIEIRSHETEHGKYSKSTENSRENIHE